MRIDHKEVDSSNIKSIGYDKENKILEVTFRNDKTYQYEDVPETIHEGLMKAGSKGNYLHLYVKKYKTTRL